MGILRKDKKENEDAQKELLNKIYKLGVDVGYFSHSEFGWVHREQKKLTEKAKKLGIEHLVKNYYEKGKAVGSERKKRDISANLGKKARDIEPEPAKEKIEKPTLGKTTPPPEEKQIKVPQSEKPQITNKPSLTQKIRATELPRLIKKITPYSKK